MPGASTPKFSIVIPAFHAAGTLAETLDALLSQTFADWEAIVVDDGSGDETFPIARAYSNRDGRIRAVHQENQGTAGAYNTGVATASGQYVVTCSADDVLLPHHLATFSAFIDDEPEYDIYSSNGYYWREGGARELVDLDPRGKHIHSLALADVIHVCFFSVGAAYKRYLFEKVGGYRRDVFGEDYDFWLRAMALGARHRYIPEPLALFRITATQKSSRLEEMYRSDIRLVSELRRDFPLNPEEIAAVDACIHERERLIAELHGGNGHRVRPALKRIAIFLFGRSRARRIWYGLRSAAAHGPRR